MQFFGRNAKLWAHLQKPCRGAHNAASPPLILLTKIEDIRPKYCAPFAHKFARFAHNNALFEKRVQLMVVTAHLLQLKPGASQSKVHSDWKYSTLIIGKQFIRRLVLDPGFKKGYCRNREVSASKSARSLYFVLPVTTEARAMYYSAATAFSSSAG